jgi:hypothetical protein
MLYRKDRKRTRHCGAAIGKEYHLPNLIIRDHLMSILP